MNLVDVADQLGTAAETITGLRVHRRPGLAIRAPALVIGFPDTITFDRTYARGCDQVDLPLFLLVGQVSRRAAAASLLAYLSGSGALSIKAAIEAGTYTACDVVKVTAATVQAITADGVEYVGATISTTITGRGA